jgi:hypothetical protein
MAWMAIRQCFTLRICFQSQVYVRGVCGGQSGTKTGFLRTALVFDYEYHYTSAPVLFTVLLRRT